MKKRLFWDNEADIAQIVTSLNAEKISICTTDTVLGFLGAATKKSFEELNSLKGRYEKPYLVLMPSKKMIEEFAQVSSQKLKELIDKVWPGPVTLIFKAKESVSEFLKSRYGTIAIRVPMHEGLQSVMKQVTPLFSTSANLAGKPIPEKMDQIDAEIIEKIEYIVTDRIEEEKSVPSTILDCTDPNNIKVVRLGVYSKEDLQDFLSS